MQNCFNEEKYFRKVNDMDFLQCPDTFKKLNNLSIAKTIQSYRKQLNLSQIKLASKSNINSAYISNIEGGKHSPTYYKMCSLSRGLDIPIDEITKTSLHEYTQMLKFADKFIFEDEGGKYFVNEIIYRDIFL